jgi:hypothetical protein
MGGQSRPSHRLNSLSGIKKTRYSMRFPRKSMAYFVVDTIAADKGSGGQAIICCVLPQLPVALR